MCQALIRDGLGVTIVTTNNGLRSGTIQQNKWLDRGFGKVIYLKTYIHYLPLRLLGVSFSKISEANIIHLTSIFYPASLIMAIAGLLIGKKVVWSARGELYPSALVYNSSLKKIILSIVKRMKNKIVFHSTCERETNYIYTEIGRDAKVIQIPNFMDLPNKLKREENQYFLFLGRIHQIKGLDKLIMALLSSTRFLNSEFTFKLVGDYNNEYGRSLMSRVKNSPLKNKVEFVGYVDEKNQKQTLIANAHFLILPSESENFGNVVVESLAQGTPVIASKGTPWEVLSSTEAGFWIANDPDSIKLTIENILSLDRTTYKQYRTNAYSLAQEAFDIDKNIDQWVKFYESILNDD